LFGPPLKLSPIFAEVLSACQTGSRSSTGNGDLLRLADQEMFEVFLTTDQNLKHQQNLTDHQVAIVVLPTTSWAVIQKYTVKIAAVLESITPGDFTEIDL
jgi:hypothetical protein